MLGKKKCQKKRIKICGRKQDLLATLIQTSENIFNSFIKFWDQKKIIELHHLGSGGGTKPKTLALKTK
jgi:hypothetical protein